MARKPSELALVSLAVPADRLMPRRSMWRKLSQGSQTAIKFTKKSLNNWLRQAGPIFDASLAMEMICFPES